MREPKIHNSNYELQAKGAQQNQLPADPKINRQRIFTSQGRRRDIRNAKGAIPSATFSANQRIDSKNKVVSRVQMSAGGGIVKQPSGNMSNSGFNTTQLSYDFASQQKL